VSERTGYDAIASFYDVDMALNMPFDDASLYRAIARRTGGRILELGCGSGRILLPLMVDGRDIVGVDASRSMLRELTTKAAGRELEPAVACMDARTLAFGECFDLVLCPYSFITFMSGTEDATRMMREVLRVLKPDGAVVLDAFVPKRVERFQDFRVDYRRPFGQNTLERSKRITALGGRTNRIERRYRLESPDGELLQEVDTREDIQTFRPEDLLALLAQSGLVASEEWWNYTSHRADEEAQFFTVLAGRR